MAGPFGVSFVPGSQDPQQGGRPGSARTGASQTPLQEAVKILSLRLPKIYGSQSIAPAPLLSAPGGMGQPGARGNVTAQALAGLAGLPASMAPPSMPAPAIPTMRDSGGSDSYSGWRSQERDLNVQGGGGGAAQRATPVPSLPAPHITPGMDDRPVYEPTIPAETPLAEPPPPPYERNPRMAEKYLELLQGLGLY